MLINTLKLMGQLPTELPIQCECGWALATNYNIGVIDSNFTELYCTNLNCPISNSKKVARALQILNLKVDMSNERALLILIHNNFGNHMDIFSLEDPMKQLPSTAYNAGLKLIMTLKKWRETKHCISLSDYMDMYNYESLGSTRCQEIFLGFTDPKNFYDFFTENGILNKEKLVKHIASRIGQGNITSTVYHIASVLLFNRKEILRTAEYFNFKKSGTGVLRLVITNEISLSTDENGKPFKPRETYKDYLERKYNINVILAKNVSEKMNYLILDSPINSRKANSAPKEKVITSCELEKLLDEGKANMSES